MGYVPYPPPPYEDAQATAEYYAMLKARLRRGFFGSLSRRPLVIDQADVDEYMERRRRWDADDAVRSFDDKGKTL